MKKIKYTYLAHDSKYYKIEQSISPEERIKSLNTSNPKIQLLKYSDKVSEKYLHSIFNSKRIFLPTGKKSEWFSLNDEDLHCIFYVMDNGEIKIGKGQGVASKTSWILNGPDIRAENEKIHARLHGLEYFGNRVDSNRKWIIPFGKYNGRKLISMQSEEEISYMQWYIREYKRNKSGYGGTYNRFSWWISCLNKLDIDVIKSYNEIE